MKSFPNFARFVVWAVPRVSSLDCELNDAPTPISRLKALLIYSCDARISDIDVCTNVGMMRIALRIRLKRPCHVSWSASTLPIIWAVLHALQQSLRSMRMPVFHDRRLITVTSHVVAEQCCEEFIRYDGASGYPPRRAECIADWTHIMPSVVL